MVSNWSVTYGDLGVRKSILLPSSMHKQFKFKILSIVIFIKNFVCFIFYVYNHLASQCTQHALHELSRVAQHYPTWLRPFWREIVTVWRAITRFIVLLRLCVRVKPDLFLSKVTCLLKAFKSPKSPFFLVPLNVFLVPFSLFLRQAARPQYF